jgi:hypothetical protein
VEIRSEHNSLQINRPGHGKQATIAGSIAGKSCGMIERCFGEALVQPDCAIAVPLTAASNSRSPSTIGRAPELPMPSKLLDHAARPDRERRSASVTMRHNVASLARDIKKFGLYLYRTFQRDRISIILLSCQRILSFRRTHS